jgi:hypothetical protein
LRALHEANHRVIGVTDLGSDLQPANQSAGSSAVVALIIFVKCIFFVGAGRNRGRFAVSTCRIKQNKRYGNELNSLFSPVSAEKNQR